MILDQPKILFLLISAVDVFDQPTMTLLCYNQCENTIDMVLLCRYDNMKGYPQKFYLKNPVFFSGSIYFTSMI